MVQPTDRILALFRRVAVMDLPTLRAKMDGRSVRSLYRDLDEIGYLSSASHTGRYYTLREGAHFDSDGLWQHGGVLFSRDGTLKETVVRLVEQADAGQRHRELALRVGLRVHNTLADLVAAERLARRLRIPANSITDSGSSRSPIPVQADHLHAPWRWVIDLLLADLSQPGQVRF